MSSWTRRVRDLAVGLMAWGSRTGAPVLVPGSLRLWRRFGRCWRCCWARSLAPRDIPGGRRSPAASRAALEVTRERAPSRGGASRGVVAALQRCRAQLEQRAAARGSRAVAVSAAAAETGDCYVSLFGPKSAESTGSAASATAAELAACKTLAHRPSPAQAGLL